MRRHPFGVPLRPFGNATDNLNYLALRLERTHAIPDLMAVRGRDIHHSSRRNSKSNLRTIMAERKAGISGRESF